MTGIRNKFISLYFSDKDPPIQVANGSSPVVGDDIVHITTLLTLNYVLLFINILSVCYQLTKLPNITSDILSYLLSFTWLPDLDENWHMS